MREKLGLNRPAHIRYIEWISGAVRGDWGTSLRLNQPVAPLIMTRLANSAVLAALTLLIAVPLAVGLGVYAGLRQGRLVGGGERARASGGAPGRQRRHFTQLDHKAKRRGAR